MSVSLSDVVGEVWAIAPHVLEAVSTALTRRHESTAAIEPEARTHYSRRSRVEVRGGVGVVQVRGVILRGASDWFLRYMGVANVGTDEIAQDLAEALANDEAERIVLHVDSPGGVASGLEVLSEQIRAAGRTKQVDAFVSGMGASAAYFLAASAGRIVAEPDALVGSIGVYATIVDSSERFASSGLKVHVLRSGEHKGMGTPGAEVTPEQLAMHQAVVDELAKGFVRAVAKGRGMKRDEVRELATGAHWLASTAKDLGLVDELGSFDQLMSGNANVAGRAQSRNRPMGHITEEGGMADQDKNTDTTTQAPPAPKAATLAELKATYPDRPAFVLEQLEAGATVEQARAAFDQVQLREARAEAEALKAELAEARASKPAASAIPAAPSGSAPLATAGDQDEGDEEPSGDFVAQAKQLKASGKFGSYREAARHLAKTNPDLHATYVQACKSNPGRKVGSKG